MRRIQKKASEATVWLGLAQRPSVGARLRDRYLVDNSVWARLPKSAVVASRLFEVAQAHEIVTATPQVLETAFSARTPAEHDEIIARMAAFDPLPMSATTHTIALNLQHGLWHSGRMRAAGAFDILLAALAIEHDVTLLHYDADYEHLAGVSALRQEWIAPRGSL